MLADGEPVPGSIALSDGNRRVTFTSGTALEANTQHTVVVSTELTDLAGNPLDNPTSFSFTTRDTGDITRAERDAVQPELQRCGGGKERGGAGGVRRGGEPGIAGADHVPAVQLREGAIRAGDSGVAADRRSATLTPVEPLEPYTQHYFYLSSFTDLAGNARSLGTIYFVTGGRGGRDGADGGGGGARGRGRRGAGERAGAADAERSRST